MVSGPSFFIDGPSKDEIDDAIALARAWAIQVTTPETLVDDEDYSAKQWALWSQQYANTVASGNHVLDSHTDVVITSASINDVLVFNGTNWINQPPAAVSTADAANVTYTPLALADWTASTDPGQVDDALDQLADRVNVLETSHDEAIVIACSDEITPLTTGVAKVTFRMPFAMTLLGVRASLPTAQTSGSILTVDINKAGTSILSTKLTIDNTEKTSMTAATLPVISDSSLTDDAEITIDIDQIGDSTAKGLKVTLIGTRT